MYLNSLSSIKNFQICSNLQVNQNSNISNFKKNCYNDTYIRNNKGTIMFGSNKYSVLSDMLINFVKEFDIDQRTLKGYKNWLQELAKEDPQKFRLLKDAVPKVTSNRYKMNLMDKDEKGNPDEYISQHLGIFKNDKEVAYYEAFYNKFGQYIDDIFDIC